MKTGESRLVHLPPEGGDAVWISSGGKSDLYRLKATSEDTGGAYALIEITSYPGNGPPPHIHHREDEYFYILEGRIEFQIGEDTTVMEAGSFIHHPRGTLHKYKNVGTEPARLLVTVVPGGWEGFAYEIGEPVTDPASSPSGPSDEEEFVRKVAEASRKYGMEIPGLTDQ